MLCRSYINTNNFNEETAIFWDLEYGVKSSNAGVCDAV